MKTAQDEETISRHRFELVDRLAHTGLKHVQQLEVSNKQLTGAVMDMEKKAALKEDKLEIQVVAQDTAIRSTIVLPRRPSTACLREH